MNSDAVLKYSAEFGSAYIAKIKGPIKLFSLQSNTD